MRNLIFRRRYLALSILLTACGSDSPAGSNLTCGPGTRQDGAQCVADVSGGGGDGGVNPEAGTTPDGGGATATPPTFGGVTSVAPASLTSLQVTWNAATDAITPAERIAYNVYVATSPGAQNFAAPTAVAPPGSTSLLINTLTGGQTYHVVVRAVNEAKLEDKNTTEQSAKTEADSTAPTFAGATGAEPAADSSLKVSWAAASDNLTPGLGMTYLVFLSETSGAQDLSGPSYVSDIGASSITIKSLPKPETTYYAVVRARDAAGNLDANKVEVSAKTGKDTAAPVFAGCTSATVKDAGSVTVTWKKATDDTTPSDQIVYDVFASKTPGGQDFTTPTATFTSGTLGVVTGLQQSSTYYFVCRARDLSNNVDQNKSERSATTLSDGVAPTFTGVKAVSNVLATSVDLTWDPGSDDQTAVGDLVYDVFQATTAGGQTFTTPVATSNAGATTVTVTGLTSATQYYWVVRARDKAGNRDTNVVEKGALTKVSFAQDVFPIFLQHCATQGCHVPGNPPFALVLVPEATAYGNIYNAASQQDPAFKRVVPNDPNASYLYRKVLGNASTGAIMPPPASNDALSQLKKDIIKNWIQEGANNN